MKMVFTSLIVILFLLLGWGTAFFYSLKKEYPIKEVPFFKNQFEVISHRGGALEVPENTILAFEHSVQLSSDIILEFDVHWTSDKQIVVLHDVLLQRTTNGEGPVQNKTLEELKKLDAAYNFEINGEFPHRGKNITIPTLEEVFQKFPNTRMIIEIKPNSMDLAVATKELIAKYQREKLTLLGSEHSPIIKYAQYKNPNLFITAGKDEILRSVMLENIFLERLDPMKADAYCIPEKYQGIQVLTPRLLTELHRRGKKAFIWTINEDSDKKRLLEMGVDGIITDRPSRLLELSNN